MTEQRSGLRFDIYERVHLPDGLAGVRELEEAELVPHIQVSEERDYAVIKGHLFLSGRYAGDNGEQGCRLEHLIPVEITMPFNRVHRVEDIRVEIDQFDIDKLSDRSLNVTGVLSLHGIEMLDSSSPAWEEAQDEEVFIHQPDPPAYREPEQEIPYSLAEAESEEEPVQEFNENPLMQELAAEEPAPVHQPVAKQQQGASHQPDKPEYEPLFGQPQAQPVSSYFTYQEEETEEPAAEAAADSQASVSSRILPNPLEPVKAAVQREPKAAIKSAEPAPEPVSSDALEWKKLFIGEEKEQNRFKRMRICIVQKEETLEQIAQRYSINSREIQLFNRLASPEIGEGQIIYIP